MCTEEGLNKISAGRMMLAKDNPAMQEYAATTIFSLAAICHHPPCCPPSWPLNILLPCHQIPTREAQEMLAKLMAQQQQRQQEKGLPEGEAVGEAASAAKATKAKPSKRPIPPTEPTSAPGGASPFDDLGGATAGLATGVVLFSIYYAMQR